MNNTFLNNPYIKIILYSFVLSYLLEIAKNATFNPIKIQLDMFLLQTLIICVLLLISKFYFPSITSEGFQDAMLEQTQNTNNKLYKEITSLNELNDLYISKKNEQLIEENKLKDSEKISIYNNLKVICNKLIETHNITDLSYLYKAVSGGDTLETFQDEYGNNNFKNNCPNLLMEQIFGVEEANRIMSLQSEEGFIEKCDTLQNDENTSKKLKELYSRKKDVNVKKIEEYTSGMFFIYKYKCLMDAQNDSQLYQCGYNYFISDLYNDERYILLSSAVSSIPPAVYRKNFYCTMKNFFNDYFENRVKQICKNNKLFKNLDKCLSEFNLLLTKKDYSDYLLRLFLGDRQISLILKEKISNDKITLKELQKELVENGLFISKIIENIKTPKSIELLKKLLKKKYSKLTNNIIENYLQNVDVETDIINPVKINLLESKSSTLFDLLIKISDRLIGNIDKYITENKLLEGPSTMDINTIYNQNNIEDEESVENNKKEDKKDKSTEKSKEKPKESKKSNVPIQDKRCGDVPGMVYCEETSKCFGPWKDKCKKMNIDDETSQKFERANQLFNSVLDSKDTPSPEKLDELNSLLDKKINWDNQYKITYDMWLKNEGKCYFSKLDLIKDKDNSYTLFWRRVDANKDGTPKKFKSLEHFNKFWDFITKNVASINSCKNPYKTYKSVQELQDEIKKMERDRYLATEVEEEVQKKINNTKENKTEPVKEKCSSDDLKSSIEKLERRIIGLETELANNRKISNAEYRKLIEEHKKAMEEYQKLVEELKNKLKKSKQQIKALNFEHQIEIEKAKKQNKCNFGPYGYYYLPPNNWKVPQPKHEVCIQEKKCAVCPLYSESNPVSYMNNDLWDNHMYLENPDKLVQDKKVNKK